MTSEGTSTRLAATRKAAIVLGLFLLLALAIYIAQRGQDIASLATFGYPGVAILMFLSSSTVLFPAPGFACVLAAGVLWNPILVGVSAGLGASMGELLGYLLGSGSAAVLNLEERKSWKQIHRWMKRNAFLAILVVAAIPNPFFDVIGLVAGSLSYPVRRFWLACVIGNSVKYASLALLASSASTWWLTR